MEKTNVMRILDQRKIPYKSYGYLGSNAKSGMEVAELLKKAPSMVFKTLVTVGKSKENYVFLIPVDKELDLKKAALSVNEKKIEMIRDVELLPLTGYIHGGCSPIGMNKALRTIIDKSAENNEVIIFNGGGIGYQIEMRLEDLNRTVFFKLADVT